MMVTEADLLGNWTLVGVELLGPDAASLPPGFRMRAISRNTRAAAASAHSWKIKTGQPSSASSPARPHRSSASSSMQSPT